MSKSVTSNDRFLRLNKKVCHISKTKVPSTASAISHLSEIVGSPLLYHKCLVNYAAMWQIEDKNLQAFPNDVNNFIIVF